jgi:hypothetical protein
MFGKKYHPIVRDQESGRGRAHVRWKSGPNFMAAWSGVGFVRHALGIV